jgi:hypothetical protein
MQKKKEKMRNNLILVFVVLVLVAGFVFGPTEADADNKEKSFDNVKASCESGCNSGNCEANCGGNCGVRSCGCGK